MGYFASEIGLSQFGMDGPINNVDLYCEIIKKVSGFSFLEFIGTNKANIQNQT